MTTVNLFPMTYCMTFGTGWRDQMKNQREGAGLYIRNEILLEQESLREKGKLIKFR